MARHVQALERFDAAMRQVPGDAGMSLRALFGTLVEQAAHAPEADALTAWDPETLPVPATWRAHVGLAVRLQQTLLEVTGSPFLARHPFARLADASVRDGRPLARLA